MKLSIVVVTFKEESKLLKACFDSVYASTLKDVELIIVDNSSEKRIENLVNSYKGARYIANPENRGFAAAVNQGMKISEGDYVLLLNPDASFEKNVLEKMIAHLDEEKDVGIGSCLIRYPDGTLQESIRRFPKVIDQLEILFKIPHVFEPKAVRKYMMRDRNAFETQDVDSIMGAFMFIRRELMNDIGLFDERYFIWFEEVDYCKMAHDAGWRIRHYADVDIMHLKGHTFSKIQTLKKQRWIRESMRKYMYKHEGLVVAGIFWLFAPVFILLAHAIAIVKPR